jgi:hypothetical protein
MALVGSLSGSNGITALTGSLIPGAVSNELGSSASKWLTVYANNITGSIQKTGGGNDFIKAGPNVTANYNVLGQWEITGTGGGSGGFFYDTAGAGKIYTTASSVAFTANEAGVDEAGDKGSDVVFYVSGSSGASQQVALFGGTVVTSGSVSVKDNVSGLQTVALGNGGTVSGSGNFTVGGTLTVNGTTVTATAPTTINLGNTAATVNVGQSGTGNALNVRGALDVDGTADVAGNVTLSGNSQTVTHSGTGDLTITSTTGNVVVEGTTFNTNDVTVAGDVAVNGGDITTTASTFNLVNTTATTVNIAGAAVTTNIGSAAGRVVIPGDLEVQGTTMTVSASNLVIEDPLLGLGFLSGSVPASATGDRGFIGGYTGGGSSNVAFGFSLANSAFVATKTNADATATTFPVSDLQPIRASRYQVSGSTAQVRGTGTNLELTGSSINLGVDDSATGIRAQHQGSTYLEFTRDVASNSTTIKANSSLLVTGSLVNVSSSDVIQLSVDLPGKEVRFRVRANSYLNFSSASYAGGGVDGPTLGNTAKIAATNDMVINPAAGLVVTGSGTAYMNVANVTFQNAGTNFLQVVSGSYTLQGSTTSQVSRLQASNNNSILLQPAANQKLFLSGTVELGGGTDNLVNFRGRVGTSIIPNGDSLYTLGTADLRWQHIYTGDLHLRNERGDYTLIEETDFLSIRFNKNGKRYKFLLERVPELDEPAR